MPCRLTMCLAEAARNAALLTCWQDPDRFAAPRRSRWSLSSSLPQQNSTVVSKPTSGTGVAKVGIEWCDRSACRAWSRGQGQEGGRRWLDSFRIMGCGSLWLACLLRCNGSGWAAADDLETDARAETRSLRRKDPQRPTERRTRRQGRTGAAISCLDVFRWRRRAHHEIQPFMARGAVCCRHGERVRLASLGYFSRECRRPVAYSSLPIVSLVDDANDAT